MGVKVKPQHGAYTARQNIESAENSGRSQIHKWNRARPDMSAYKPRRIDALHPMTPSFPMKSQLSVLCLFAVSCASQAAPVASQPTPAPPTAGVEKASEGPAPTCSQGTRPAADGLIDDFEAADGRTPALAGRDQTWWMSGDKHAKIAIPGATFAASEGGPTGSKKAIHFAGTSAFEDDWGAIVGVNFLPSGFYDASKYAGIAFKIRAAKPNTNIRLKVSDVASHPDGGQCTKHCWNSFGKELIVETEWQSVALMWSDLAQQPDWGDVRPPAITPSKLRDAEWTVYPSPAFDFWVDDIHFLECN